MFSLIMIPHSSWLLFTFDSSHTSHSITVNYSHILHNICHYSSPLIVVYVCIIGIPRHLPQCVTTSWRYTSQHCTDERTWLLSTFQGRTRLHDFICNRYRWLLYQIDRITAKHEPESVAAIIVDCCIVFLLPPRCWLLFGQQTICTRQCLSKNYHLVVYQ